MNSEKPAFPPIAKLLLLVLVAFTAILVMLMIRHQDEPQRRPDEWIGVPVPKRGR